jgi:hypothetical protein
MGNLICYLSIFEIVSLRYSTGAVSDYSRCGGVDLALTIPECYNFRLWYDFGKFQLFSRWENGDVWGSDFRDASNGDLEPNGGSDIPEVYFYAGHGKCQDSPSVTSPDFIAVCGDFGKPDNTIIGTQCRWGNRPGNLRFAFIDASCPMDLVSITNSWFPVFQGLHMAIGHSGTSTQDAFDSADRGSQFAGYTSGVLWLFPHLSVGDAWMITGLIDVQTGCCAVALAAGTDRDDSIDRCNNEKVKDNRPNPTPNWFTWRWVCL